MSGAMDALTKNDIFQSVIDDELPFDYLSGTAECLKAIAHPTRLQIILYIMKGRFTVEQVSNHCGLPHAQTSGHLRLMESKGLLHRERNGRKVYYSVHEPHLIGIMECIKGRYFEKQETMMR